MKVLIDTNILISAALNLNSTPGQAFFKAATLEAFLAIALTTISIVSTPDVEHETEKAIRDVMDRPILRLPSD